MSAAAMQRGRIRGEAAWKRMCERGRVQRQWKRSNPRSTPWPERNSVASDGTRVGSSQRRGG